MADEAAVMAPPPPSSEQSGPVPAGQSVTGRTVVGATWMFAYRMTTRGLGLVSTLILAHLLVAGDFGLVAMATAFYYSIDSLSEMGLIEALVRRPDQSRLLSDTAFTLQLARGALTGTVVAVAAYPAGTWFAEPRLPHVLLALAGLAVASGLENIGIMEYRRSLRFDMEFLLNSLPRLTAFILTTTTAWLTQSYWSLIAGIAGAKLLRLVLTYVLHPYRPRLAIAGWRDLAGFSFWSWAVSLAFLVWSRCDAFILGPVLGSASLGLYLLSNEIAVLPISELVTPAASVLFASFALVQNRGTNTVALALPTIATLLLFVAPLAVGLSATSGYIVTGMLGPKWTAAQPLISMFACLCVFSPFSAICSTIMSARGRVRENFFSVALAAAVKVAVVWIASHTGRLEVVVAASLITVGAETVIFVGQLARHGDLEWRRSSGAFLRITASGGVAAATLWLSGWGWVPVNGPPLLALTEGIATGIVGIVVFAAVQGALWVTVGRPDGPERKMIEIASVHLMRPLLWLARRRAKPVT